jgi:predicted nucleic acid-binding protein
VALQPATSLYTTSITQAEILHGVLLLAAGKRRNAFEAAAQAMFNEDFAGRILPFGSDAAAAYARIAAARCRAGHLISHFDAQSPLSRTRPEPQCRPAMSRISMDAVSR